MQFGNHLLAPFARDEDGRGLAEYALILALIAIVAIVALIFLGGQVSGILSDVGSSDLTGHPPDPATNSLVLLDTPAVEPYRVAASALRRAFRMEEPFK
ncbi:MAG: Flp family type IVb pilin [Candidatus Limnocylindrales bacterium]